MDVQAYQIAARRTAKKMHVDDAFKHAALGLGSDMGEVASLLKAKLVYNDPIERPKLVKELGDVTWFTSYACDIFGVGMEEIVFLQITDHRYMTSRNPLATSVYWAMMGLKVAGDFNDLVAGGCDQVVHKSIGLLMLAKLYVCITQIASRHDIEIEEVFVENIAKLLRRFPLGYSDQDAITRADKPLEGVTLTALPETGTLCSECASIGLEVPQVESPSGVTCKFGHGGADDAKSLGMEDGTYGGHGTPQGGGTD